MKRKIGVKWLAVLFFMTVLLFANVLDAKAGSIDWKKYRAFEKGMQGAMNNFQSTIQLSSYGIQHEDMIAYNHMFMRRNPRYFYGKPTMFYGWPGQAVHYQELTYSANARSEKQKYEQKVASILKLVNKKWSDYEKALFLHDYLALNNYYSMDGKWKKHAFDAYGALVNGKSVCDGYARAYMDLMNRVGIPCEHVQSTEKDHAWNIAKIGGNWYYVDVTFDDPWANPRGDANHEYFLKSYDWLKAEGRHLGKDTTVTGGIKLKDAKNKKYDDYDWEENQRAFHYYKGKWYTGAHQTSGEVNVYKYDKKEKMLIKKKTLFTVEDEWIRWESGNVDDYHNSAGFIYKGRFYYNTPKQIYYYDLKTGEMVLVHTDTSEGNIYEMEQKNGKLTYYVKESRVADSSKKVTIKL